jgi:hypothetical protein
MRQISARRCQDNQINISTPATTQNKFFHAIYMRDVRYRNQKKGGKIGMTRKKTAGDEASATLCESYEGAARL